MQAYFWIRGYSLASGDDGKMELHRGMHHPLYDQQVRVAYTWDYFWDGEMEGVQEKMLAWVKQVEQPGQEERPGQLLKPVVERASLPVRRSLDYPEIPYRPVPPGYELISSTTEPQQEGGQTTNAKHNSDHTSVGALIFNAQGQLLLFQRGTPPWGVAGPAGHGDGDAPEQAISKEVREEVGLQVITAQCVATFRIYKACRRPCEGTPYHDWWFYLTNVSGEIRPSARETRAVRWYSLEEIAQLMQRTEDYHLFGKRSEEQWQQQPGLDLPWYRLFKAEIPLTTLASLQPRERVQRP